MILKIWINKKVTYLSIIFHLYVLYLIDTQFGKLFCPYCVIVVVLHKIVTEQYQNGRMKWEKLRERRHKILISLDNCHAVFQSVNNYKTPEEMFLSENLGVRP